MDSEWCHVLTLILCQNMFHVWPSRTVQIYLCSFRLGVSRLWVSTLGLELLPQISVVQTASTSPPPLPRAMEEAELLTACCTVSLIVLCRLRKHVPLKPVLSLRNLNFNHSRQYYKNNTIHFIEYDFSSVKDFRQMIEWVLSRINTHES